MSTGTVLIDVSKVAVLAKDPLSHLGYQLILHNLVADSRG